MSNFRGTAVSSLASRPKSGISARCHWHAHPDRLQSVWLSSSMNFSFVHSAVARPAMSNDSNWPAAARCGRGSQPTFKLGRAPAGPIRSGTIGRRLTAIARSCEDPDSAKRRRAALGPKAVRSAMLPLG